jgi:F0F1-type ATP synthase membrane subunit c/vacuolar-type H+-ATPase subunit K
MLGKKTLMGLSALAMILLGFGIAMAKGEGEAAATNWVAVAVMIGLALIESLCIYALVICLIMLFTKS